MAEKNGQKDWMIENWEKNAMTPREMYNASQNIAKARKQAEGLPLFGNGYIGNLVGGAGSSFLRGLADTAGFLNLNNAENVLGSGADYIEERLPTPKPAAWTWDYLSSPEGWARGIGNVGGSIASIALPAGGIALKAPNLLTKAAQGLSAFTRGGIGLDTAKGLILGGFTVPTEAAMEGRNFEKNAIAAGMTPEEARQKSWDVFWRNMGILGLSNTIQGGLFSKVFGKGNTLKGRLGAGAAEVGMQTEEEFLQEAAQNELRGKPYTYNPFNLGNPKYPEQNQAALEGFMGIAPLTALGGVGGYGYHKYFGKDEEQEFEKLPAGAFEGQYWRKQHDGVKYEGAQPQTMKAIDTLGKWFYEKTGAPLIVTSVTDGGSHKDGEHSHYNGWKVDVNDFGSGMEGAITTEDGKKGWLADEFIKYGQSLGLGMNWENDHIDVAVDGTQWDGLSEIKNFGGFKYSATESKSAPMTKEEFFAAVASQESGGDYNAENGRTGAFGKYQIMPENWASWAEEAGLSPDAPKTPENQEIIAKFKLGQYFDKYGAEGALVAWYAGEQNGQRWKDGKADAIGANGNHYSWDAPQGNGNEPSVREYVQQTLGRINSNPQNYNIESPVEETAETSTETETEKQRPYFVDEIIKDLFSKKIEPNFKVESQDKLTQAVYEDFIFDKLQDTESKSFFEEHPELFDNDNKFVDNAKNRETVAEQFGADTINDFGQKLVADRIAAIRNIQSPTEHFTTSETTGKDDVKIFHSELAELPPKQTQKEIVNLAYRYGGTPDKKGTAFNFSNDEDRAAFMQEAENFIQNPVPSNAPPKNSKAIEEILAQNATTFNPFKINPVTKNIITQFAQQKYEKRNTPEGRAEFKQNFKGMFKDGTFQNTAANREKLAEIYSDELQNFGQNELDKQIAEYQNWTQQTAQSQFETLQEKIEPARIKLEEAIAAGNADAVKKYGAEYQALGDQLREIQAQLQQPPFQPAENISQVQTELQ
ncbi:MAG: transglycosylase SLT domain-containing protein, partial [Selenomonadaceae bacterium]|nr:transglycosylase SLT domain-containing protein [Selenomonadaceae bacterium]